MDADNADMATIEIRDVPQDVCDALAEQARRAGQSFDAYVRSILVREVMAQAHARRVDAIRTWPGAASFGPEDVTGVLDAGRPAR